MILKVIAYQQQDSITNYFENEINAEVKNIVEYIDNKILFEKKLNIIANNRYFLKKDKYTHSDIKNVKDLANWAIIE